MIESKNSKRAGIKRVPRPTVIDPSHRAAEVGKSLMTIEIIASRSRRSATELIDGIVEPDRH
jgi:hypothetical protein